MITLCNIVLICGLVTPPGIIRPLKLHLSKPMVIDKHSNKYHLCMIAHVGSVQLLEIKIRKSKHVIIENVEEIPENLLPFQNITIMSLELRKKPNSTCYVTVEIAYRFNGSKCSDVIEIREKGDAPDIDVNELIKHDNYFPLTCESTSDSNMKFIKMKKRFSEIEWITTGSTILNNIVDNAPKNLIIE